MSDRESYNWVMFTKDLSLMSHLTLHEAGRIAFCFENSSANLHPYDILGLTKQLVCLLQAPVGEVGAEKFATYMLEFRKYENLTEAELARVDRQLQFLTERALPLTVHKTIRKE